MAPRKKRLLIGFAAVYVAIVAAVFVHAFVSTKGTAKIYVLTPQVVGTRLGEPLRVEALRGTTLDEHRARALNHAQVTTVTLADGRTADTEEAVGQPLGTLVLPAGTEITEELYHQVVAPEATARPEQQVLLVGQGNIIGFSLTLVLVVLNFLGLLCILYVFVWDPVLEMLDKRAETIRGHIETAEQQRGEAHALRQRYAGLMTGAKREREDLINSGQRDGEAERQRIIQRTRAEAEKILEAARTEIGAEAARVRRELQREVGSLSTQIAGEILRRELRPEDHEVLVQDFLRKLDESGGNGRPAARREGA